MKKPLRIDAEAEEELAAAVAWYEARRVGLGRDLVTCVRETFERIDRDPKAWSRSPNVEDHLGHRFSTVAVDGVRRCLVRRFPYAVVYIVLDAEIRILAIAHTSREPGYWQRR